MKGFLKTIKLDMFSGGGGGPESPSSESAQSPQRTSASTSSSSPSSPTQAKQNANANANAQQNKPKAVAATTAAQQQQQMKPKSAAAGSGSGSQSQPQPQRKPVAGTPAAVTAQKATVSAVANPQKSGANGTNSQKPGVNAASNGTSSPKPAVNTAAANAQKPAATTTPQKQTAGAQRPPAKVNPAQQSPSQQQQTRSSSPPTSSPSPSQRQQQQQQQQATGANRHDVQKQEDGSGDEDDLFGGMEMNDTEDHDAPKFANPMKSPPPSTKTGARVGEESQGDQKKMEEGNMFDGMDVETEPTQSEDKEAGSSAFSFLTVTKSPAPPPRNEENFPTTAEAKAADHPAITENNQPKDYSTEGQDESSSIDQQERKAQLAKRAGGKTKKKTTLFGFQETEGSSQSDSPKSLPENDQPKEVKENRETFREESGPKEDKSEPTSAEKKPAVAEDVKESVKESVKEEPRKAPIQQAASPIPSPSPSDPRDQSPQKGTEINNQIVKVAGGLKKTEAEEEDLLKKLTTAHMQVIELWHSVKVTEDRLREASEREDYDLAEQLAMSLDHTLQEIHARERQTEEINTSLSEIHDRKAALIQAEFSSRNELITQLTNAKSAQEKTFEVDEETTSTGHRREGLRLEMELERIERERSRIKSERELVEEDKIKLQGEISSEGKGFLDQRDQAVAKKQKVSEKIKDLVAQLEQLRQEEQECTEIIDNAEGEIKKVAELYSAKQSQIEADESAVDQKEAGIQGKLSDIQISQTKLKETMKSFETVKIEHLKKLGALEGQLVEHVDLNRALQLRLDHTRQVYRRIADGLKRGEAPELDRKRQACETKRMEAKQLTEETARDQKAVSDAKRTIAASEEKLPELEKQKKLAVSTKNFKEASRVAADIKAITSEKEGLEEELKELQQAHSTKEQARIEAGNELRELSEACAKLEHDHDLSILAKYEQILESSKEEHARITLLDLPDVENVSATHLKTLASVILQLKIKHSLISDPKLQSGEGIQELVERLSMDGVEEFKKRSKTEAEEEESAANFSGHAPEEVAISSPHDSARIQEGNSGEEEEEVEEGEGEAEEEEIKTEIKEEVEEEGVTSSKAGENLDELKARVMVLESEVEEAVEKEDYDLAAALQEEIEKLQAKISPGE